jgi:hypothetical protein
MYNDNFYIKEYNTLGGAGFLEIGAPFCDREKSGA